MAEVSIDVDAMDDLIASLDTARDDVTGAAGRLRGRLEGVDLSTTR